MANSGVFLKKRPGYRKPVTVDCFEVHPVPEPHSPGQDQVLVETINFSLDPLLRFRMDEHDVQVEYMRQWSLDQPCQGLSGVGKVVAVGEGVSGFKRGDLVTCLRGWAWQRHQLFSKHHGAACWLLWSFLHHLIRTRRRKGYNP